MLTTRKLLESPASEIVLGFDLEWTKNYRISNGNKPFCFSFVYFTPSVDLHLIEEDLELGFISKYVEDKKEIPSLIEDANRVLGDFIQRYELVVVGHQLPSDMGVLIKYDSTRQPRNLLLLRQTWRKRNQPGDDNSLTVFDTRYDLDTFLVGKSRRLVDVCIECKLDVTQPELGSSSMTQMQNDFYRTQNKEIMEKLSVLNLRHSLSAALLYSCFVQGYKPASSVNVNKIIYKNLRGCFEYIQDEQFKRLISAD